MCVFACKQTYDCEVFICAKCIKFHKMWMYSFENYNSKHEFDMREKQIAEDIVGIVENTDLEALHEVKAKNTYLVVMD